MLLGGPIAAAGASGGVPRFRFLQVNDLHYAAASSRGYSGALQRIEWLFERIRSKDFFPPLDFVIGVGDLVHGGTLEAIRDEMPALKRKTDGLGVPFYPVIGNHENVQSEGDAVLEGPFREAFGPDRLNYSFTSHGIEFLVVNDSGTACQRPKEVYAERLRRLETMLKANPRLPKVICCHIPLVPIREGAVLRKSFGFASYKVVEPEVLEAIEARGSGVRAVLSGHLHLTGRVRRNGIDHVSICGTASFPHDVALYSVYTGRIDVEVIRLRSDLLVPETNIHGFRRHRVDYADAAHPDYTRYLLGNPDERRWSIPL